MSTVTIEWAPFTLAEGADEEQLLKASEVLHSGFLSLQRGFIRRELLKGKDGQWIDLVHWEGAEAAQEAFKMAMRSPVCLQYFQLMATPDSGDLAGTVAHFTLMRAYESRAQA